MNHPGVLQIHGVFENDSHVFFVVDYLDGGDIFKYLKCINRGYDEYTGATIVKRILTSLAYIHSLGIIHRDIKVLDSNIISRKTLYYVVEMTSAMFVLQTLDLQITIAPMEITNSKDVVHQVMWPRRFSRIRFMTLKWTSLA